MLTILKHLCNALFAITLFGPAVLLIIADRMGNLDLTGELGTIGMILLLTFPIWAWLSEQCQERIEQSS